jgi:hypothetical protein
MHVFGVRARDEFGNLEPELRSITFEVDATQPAPQLTSPGAGNVLKGEVEIRGSTDDLRFESARVLVRPLGAATWAPPDAVELYADSVAIVDGAITTWNTAGWEEGDYEVAVFVADTLGLVGTTGPVRVTVDNLFPFFAQTAPARVSAATGGNIYTTNQELKLFFPPNAFDQDARVEITPASGASAPDSLGPGVVRVTPAYHVQWPGAQLEKAATLEMNYIAASVPPDAPLAVYAAADSAWVRLGGTVTPGRSIVGTTVQGPARYALFAEIGAPGLDGRFLGEIVLAPRVFSPRGNFSDTRVAIGFTLGRAAPVTVKVYNRAGRHVQTVSAGQTFGPGKNLVYWDGNDREGRTAIEGVYLVTVEALDQRLTQTVAVVN